jgi:hypothetical protein
MLEVPLPPQGIAQVQYTIGEKTILLSRPPPNDLPLSEVLKFYKTSDICR